MSRPPSQPTPAVVMAVRLYDQADTEDKGEALLRAAAMLATSLGHGHTGKRLLATTLPSLRKQRGTLNDRRKD